LSPGGVPPAEPAYRSRLDALGNRVDAVAKDLELDSADHPSADYSLETEIEGIVREAAADDSRHNRLARLNLVANRRARVEPLSVLEELR
jgi:hypothetical protein